MQSENYRGEPDAVSEDVLERHREAAAPIQERYDLYIGGEWSESDGGDVVESLDAITGETLAEYQQGTAADVDRAVDAAEEAYRSEWGELSSSERAEYLEELADAIEEKAELLSTIDTLETGFPILTTPALAQQTAGQLRYFASVARSTDKGAVPSTGEMEKHHHIYTQEEPYGVVGLITPWNGPLGNLGVKLAPALAAGNTVVYKPSPRGVVSSFEAMDIIDDVLPDGTVNMVPGTGPEVGEAISSHSRIRKVSLTGSTAAGQSVMKSAASNIKAISLELGGKSPSIVFPDADLETTAQGVAMGIYGFNGQVCTAGSRLFLHEDIYDEFLETLSATAEQMFQMGDPLDDGTMLGPLIDHKHLDRVQSYVDEAVEDGATLYMGGESQDIEGLGGAPFFEPTILTDVDNDDTVACEEVFGPVLTVLKWSDREEMLELANDTEYGLASGIWTQDLQTAHTVSDELEAGVVWVNCYNAFQTGVPHGGYKQSGAGREMNRQAYHEYRQTKTVNINLSDTWPRM
ncbi:Aldehyde Dehydrogenase (plasmid) [Haloterrigena turkmenica DSM 5511]|uniref:Aldehyde Dehydrogenase n=1 Tax=Haloterrigena turkmenica (strain ATCC 51198 / DSM 5511 / JCM 9101 / NCIMB 13204 / VKM B-1734 / 4k) TaxID=543526 RepID=D2RZY5_HALTV|nr:Aldehyde Dehydrogenase [Haloterrigena turkmenica DSM 5511]